MVNKLDYQTIVNKLDSIWVPHISDLVPQLSLAY